MHKKIPAVSTAALLGILAGCGSSAASIPAPSRAVLSAYTTTTAAKTAKISLNEQVSASAAGSSENVSISGTGAVNFATGQSELTFSIPNSGTFTVEVVLPNVYIKVPAQAASQLPPGKTWMSINIDTVTEAKFGASISQLSSSSQTSTQALSYLQAVSATGVNKVGPAEIRGVAATEYKAEVDLSKVAAGKSSQAQAAIQKLESQLHTSMLPVQVWLDSHGRTVQITYQVPFSTASSSGSSGSAAAAGSVNATIDYYDFGTPVTVSPPPASQVYNATSEASSS